MELGVPWPFVGGPMACLVLVLTVVTAGATLRQPPPNISSDEVYRDCSDLPSYMPSGVYTLRPGMIPLDVPAYCDMDNDGGGWTVVIRRNGIEPREDFYRDWESYKWGLGELEEEFYWGNEYLWMLTSHLDRRYQVHFWLEDFDGNTRYALYQNFVIESEEAYYRLQVGEYSGDAGDSMSYHNNQAFSTFDKDHSCGGNCASEYNTAWWLNCCNLCDLAGEYYEGGNTGSNGKGILWRTWKDTDPYSLKAAVMKIKPSEKA